MCHIFDFWYVLMVVVTLGILAVAGVGAIGVGTAVVGGYICINIDKTCIR